MDFSQKMAVYTLPPSFLAILVYNFIDPGGGGQNFLQGAVPSNLSPPLAIALKLVILSHLSVTVLRQNWLYVCFS